MHQRKIPSITIIGKMQLINCISEGCNRFRQHSTWTQGVYFNCVKQIQTKHFCFLFLFETCTKQVFFTYSINRQTCSICKNRQTNKSTNTLTPINTIPTRVPMAWIIAVYALMGDNGGQGFEPSVLQLITPCLYNFWHSFLLPDRGTSAAVYRILCSRIAGPLICLGSRWGADPAGELTVLSRQTPCWWVGSWLSPSKEPYPNPRYRPFGPQTPSLALVA